MSTATAKLSGYRQAPRKVRLIAGLVRGKSVERALIELEHRAKRSAPVFAKLIKSAVANAKALGLDEKSLEIVEVRVDKGAVLKRSRPRAHGRAFPIHKHTSHILLTLRDRSAKEATAKAAVVTEEGETKKTAKTTATKAAKPAAKKPATKSVTKKTSTAKAK